MKTVLVSAKILLLAASFTTSTNGFKSRSPPHAATRALHRFFPIRQYDQEFGQWRRKNLILAAEESSGGKEAIDNEKSSSVAANNSNKRGYRFGDISRSIIDRAKESVGKEVKQSDKGYRFGDITRSLIDKATDITGKESYSFGDLTRWADQVAKEKVANITGKEKYEFGDLTKSFVSNYTGKANYTVGDLSQEVVRRIQSGEYTVEDVWLALRILLSAGFGIFAPVAGILPIRLLLNLVNMGLAQEVSGRMLGALAETLDKRMKEVFTGSSSYALGDMTKDRLQSQLSKFTGKPNYEFGDLSRTISKLAAQTDRSSKTGSVNKKIEVQESILDNLESWDKQKAATKG